MFSDLIYCTKCVQQQERALQCHACGTICHEYYNGLAQQAGLPLARLAPPLRAHSKPRNTRQIKIAATIVIVLWSLLAIGIVGSIHLIKSSDVYQVAMTFIAENETLRETVGEPVEPEFLGFLSIRSTSCGRQALVRIDVEGSIRDGNVAIILFDEEGRWVVDDARFQREGGSEWIQLIESSEDEQAPRSDQEREQPAPSASSNSISTKRRSARISRRSPKQRSLTR